MARGDDSGKPSMAPPKRNPFQQEIANSEKVKKEKKKAEQQASKDVAAAIQADVREVFLKDAFDEKNYDPDGSYDSDEDVFKYPYISDSRVEEMEEEERERSRRMREKILNEVSDKLAELAGSDISLADKLERVLLDQGESVFYIDHYDDNWHNYYWVQRINEDSLRRLLRNLERTALLHAQEKK